MDKRQLGKTSEKLAAMCRKSRFFRCASKYSVPSDESARDILTQFQEVLFIGYFGKQEIPDWDLEPHLHVLMSHSSTRLRPRSPRASCTSARCRGRAVTAAARAARRMLPRS